MEAVSLFPESTEVDDISLDFTLSSHLLNRTQWYYLHCKFSQKDKPAFVGQTIAIDPSVSFQDGRKRTSSFNNTQPPFLSLSVSGVCKLTGKLLQKCRKCKAQDKITTNRKRKRDINDSWTYVDEGNNTKLFQVMNSVPKVDEEGFIKLRFRALCCIGATRQVHNNHINENEGDEEGIHKGCDGFLLSVILSMEGEEIFRRTSEEPIRVIGKVPKTQTSTNSREKQEKKYIQQTCHLETSHFYTDSNTPSPESPTVPFGSAGDHGLEITPLPVNTGGLTTICTDDPRFLFGTQVTMDNTKSLSKMILDSTDNFPIFHAPSEGTINGSVSSIQMRSSSFSGPATYLKQPFQNQQVTESFDNNPLCEYDEGELQNYQNFPCAYNEFNRKGVHRASRRISSYDRMDLTNRRDGFKSGISDFLDSIQEGTDLFAELRNTALLFKIKIDSKYPIVYRKIFEPDFFKQSNLLKIPSESTELLIICNVIYEGTLCRENSSVYSKNKVEQLSIIGENIAHHLLKSSVRDLSSEDKLNLADALCRTGIILVHQQNDLASGRYFLHQSFQLYEHLSVLYPHIRTTPYYEFMMWHRCFLDPDPALINLTFEWLCTVPKSKIFPHIIFLMIYSVCYPGLSTGAAGVPDRPHFPVDSQKRYLLGLCNDLESVIIGNNGNVTVPNRILIDSSIRALRSWLMCDLDQAMEDVEESAIQASLVTNAFMDPLPVQIAIFVAVQLMGVYALQEPLPVGGEGDLGNSQEEKQRRRLVHYVELLVKASRIALVQVWTASLEVFNLTMFHKFCGELFQCDFVTN